MLDQKIKFLEQFTQDKIFADIMRGVEKENLRVDSAGRIAQSDHPAVFGSSLTNPYLTTDFSEAQLEMITPPIKNLNELEGFLFSLHSFLYHNLNDELLWPSSMPCWFDNPDEIVIAKYGTSNAGKLKEVYRRGLCHRYGRVMQAISGIHYNVSLPDKLFEHLKDFVQDKKDLSRFKSESYFNLIRNFYRYYWLIPYLFGASAICMDSSIGPNRPEYMQKFDDLASFAPFGTSLRMSDLGYQSSFQAKIHVDYKDVSSYAKSLLKAIMKKHKDLTKIGIKDKNGAYRQLTDSILQIENEYYSPIRPKQIVGSCQRLPCALMERGVAYVEVRALDINPLAAVGIDKYTMAFLDVFLLFCMLEDSPLLSAKDDEENRANLSTIVAQGREPGLVLQKNSRPINFIAWAIELLDKMAPVAQLLKAGSDEGHLFVQALKNQRQKILEVEYTPSAQLLRYLKDQKLTFNEFNLRKSKRWMKNFNRLTLNDKTSALFTEAASESFTRLQELEAADTKTFEEYLHCYYSGVKKCCW